MSSSADNGQTRNGKKKKKKGKVGKVFPMHPVIIQTGSDQEELLKRSGKGHKDLLETTHKRNSAANFITNYQLVKKGVDRFKNLKCGRRSRNGGSTGMLHSNVFLNCNLPFRSPYDLTLSWIIMLCFFIVCLLFYLVLYALFQLQPIFFFIQYFIIFFM